MPVIRIEKNNNYTVMSNSHLRENKMSLKAIGLMSKMLSLPKDWDYSVEGLVAICKENATAIQSALDELKKFGYLQVIKKMPNETNSGRIEYEYVLHEQKQGVEKQGVENLGLEFLGVENQGQLNTNNKINNNKINNNKKEINKEKIELISTLNSYKDNFSEECFNAIRDWLKYKKEKKQSYKLTGLKTLLNKLKGWKENNGDSYVIDAIENSICNNYSGIFPKKDKQVDTPKKYGDGSAYDYIE